MLTGCGCSPTAVAEQSGLSLTGPANGRWTDCKDCLTGFAGGRVGDTCGKDAVEGAQAAAASFDRNLPRALPQTPVYQRGEEEEQQQKEH